MSNADSKGRNAASEKRKEEAPARTKHVDTGEHAKKNTSERAHVVDEGLGMSKYDSTRKS